LNHPFTVFLERHPDAVFVVDSEGAIEYDRRQLDSEEFEMFDDYVRRAIETGETRAFDMAVRRVRNGGPVDFRVQLVPSDPSARLSASRSS